MKRFWLLSLLSITIVGATVDSPETILEFLKTVTEEFSPSQEDAVIVIGDTGSGKTTLSLLLTDAELISKPTCDDCLTYTISDANELVGTVTAESKTLIPNRMVSKDPAHVVYYDNPGFKDMRSSKYEITIAYLINKLLTTVKSFKLLLVVNHAWVIRGSERPTFPKFIESVIKLMKNIESYKGGVALAATKVDNTFETIDGQQRLVEDDQVIEGIVEFLEDEKTRIEKLNAANNISLAQRENNLQKIKILDTLLLRENGKDYARIGIFRKPGKAGPLKNIKLIQKEKIQLQKLIERLEFVHRNDTLGFGYILSQETVIIASDLIKKLLNNDIKYAIHDVCREVKRYYEEAFQKKLDITHLKETKSEAIERMGKISFVKPVLCLKSFIAATSAIVSATSIKTLERHVEFLEVLSNMNQAIHSTPAAYKESTNEVINHIEGVYKRYVSGWAKDLLQVKLPLLVNDICSEMKIYCERLEKSTNDVYLLHDKLALAYEKLFKVKIINPESILHAIRDSGIVISSANWNILADMAPKIEMAIKINTGDLAVLNSSQLKLENMSQHFNKAAIWYNYVIEIYSDITAPKHDISGKEYIPMNNIIDKYRSENMNGNDEDLQKLSQYTQKDYTALKTYENVIIDIEKKQALVNVFKRLTKKIIINCKENKWNMTVTGNIIRTSQIVGRDKECWPYATSIQFYAMDSIIIDKSVSKTGHNDSIVIMSPVWVVFGKQKIFLKGLSGPTKEDAKNGENSVMTPVNGDNGEAGHPGKQGGNFLGIGLKFFNGHNLEVISQGGDGGPGAKGGKGSLGKDSVPRKHVEHYEEKVESCKIWSFPWNIEKCIDAFFCEENDYERIGKLRYRRKGLPGTNGGDGGDGGVGGPGGKPGHVKIIELENVSDISRETTTGRRGEDGQGGTGGRSALRCVYSVLGIEFQVSGVPDDVPVLEVHCFETEDSNVNERTKEGKTGYNGRSMLNYLEAFDAGGIYRPSHAVNKFKNLIHQDLKQHFGQSERIKFVARLEEDPEVKQLYDVKGFIDELKGLEHLYDTLEPESFYTPFYESLFSRVIEYTKTRKLTPDEKVAFKFVITSVTSKLFTLRKKTNARRIYDLQTFLKEVEKEVQKVKDVSAKDAINTYRTDYRKLLEEKRQAAESLVKDKVMPEISNIFRDVDHTVLVFIDEIIELKSATEENLQEIRAKEKLLKESMKLHMLLAPLKIMGTTLSFFGPYGAAAGAVIAGATSILESSANNPGAIEYNAMSEKFKESVEKLTVNYNNDLALVKGQVGAIKKVAEQCVKDQVHNDQSSRNGCANMKTRMIDFQKDIEKLESDCYDTLNVPNVREIKKNLKNIADEMKNIMSGKSDNSKSPGNKVSKKVAGKIESIAGCSDMPIGLFDQFKDDEDKIREARAAITELTEQLEILKMQEQNVYKIMIPGIREMKANVMNMVQNAGNPHAELTIVKWRMQSFLRDVSSLVNRMANGFSSGEDFRVCLAKIEVGVSALIDIYDSMDSYADSQLLGKLIADVGSVGNLAQQIHDQELSDSVDNVELVLRSNILLDKYNQALRGVLQHYFPVILQFFINEELPDGLVMEDLQSMTIKAAKHISYLRTEVNEEQALSTEYDSEMREEVYYDGTENNQPPFYVWKHKAIKQNLKDLFEGKTVMFIADSKNGIDANVVKFSEIGIHFNLSSSTEQEQKDFEEKLKKFRITMSLSGNNYYRCNNRFYFLPLSEKIDLEFNLVKDKNGKWKEPNSTYKKIRDNRAFLSPFGTWSMKLSGELSELEKFKEVPMDLQLIGYGQHMEPREFLLKVCNEDLDKYYSLDHIDNSIISAKE